MVYPAQQNATDQTANFFWYLVILAVGAGVLWWVGGKYIVSTLFWVRHYEVDFINFILTLWNRLATELHWPTVNLTDLNLIQSFMSVTPATAVKFKQVTAISTVVGKWLRYPVIVILLVLATFLYFRHGTMRFQQVYTMESLKKCEVQNWPQIQPIMSLDLLKTDLDTGPWAMAKTPLDFCKQHDLLRIVERQDSRRGWSIKAGPAERLLVMQIGPLWSGVQHLPIHIRALVAIFVSKVHRDHETSTRLIDQIAVSAGHGRLNFSGVDDVIKKYESSKIIKWLERRHAFVSTLLASLLEICRADGVLATAEFLWLKPIDRRLWYMLNSVGRQTAVVEISGAFSHWLAEKKLQRALRTPMVKEAVNALEIAVNDILYVHEDERWHTSNVG